MTDVESNQPISQHLSKEMRCGIFSNEHGQITIIHDQEIKESVQWVEYNQQDNQLFIIHENGMPQDLGIEIQGQMKENLIGGIEVIMLQLRDEKLVNHRSLTIIIQDY